jgi:hypothetical protein
MGDLDVRVPTAVRTPSTVRVRRGWLRRQESGDPPASRVRNVPDRTAVLVGHRGLLAAVQRTLWADRRALVCPAGGRSGSGATTAMIDFAHRNAHAYDIAWWIRATDPELVPDELAALAEALGVAGPDDDAETAAARALHALRHRDRFLLVFDDAGRPHQLARFLPDGPGHVVITSADPEWRSYATAHPVGPFSRAESVALLTARRPDLPVDDAVRVAAALEDLPVAVDPAAVLLAQSRMSTDSFLRLLAHRCTGGRPDPVAATWRVAVDRLDVVDPVGLAVLTLVAWLGPDPVPWSVLVEHPDLLPAGIADDVRSPAALTERITDLGRQGLIGVTAAGVRLPRRPTALLVARTAHTRVGSGGWADAAVRLLRAAVPEDVADPAMHARWRSLLPLVLAVTDPARRLDVGVADATWLLRAVASYLDVRGQRRTADVLARGADDLERPPGRVVRPATTR